MAAFFEWLGSLNSSAWVSIGGAVVSIAGGVLGHIISWRRAKAATENNIIAGTSAWAQALMKYVEKEIEFTIQDEKVMKSLFRKKFTSVKEKKDVFAALNAARQESAKNVAFLNALSGRAKELVDCQARLINVYDSFMESAELKVTDEARRVLEKYNSESEMYLKEIRNFAISLGVERGTFVSDKTK